MAVMRPDNFIERRKRILAFAGLYAASIILLFFIFSAFGGRLSVSDPNSGRAFEARQPASDNNNDVLRADSLLHMGLYRLQQLDDQYAMLPDGSDAAVRNSIAALVSGNEQVLKKQVDSVEQLSAVYAGAGKSALYKTIINSFRAALNERQSLKNIRMTIASGNSLTGGGQQDVLLWKNELLQKDNEITGLKTELKDRQGVSFASSANPGAQEARKGEIDLLKTAFNDQQKEYDLLKDKYNRLKTDNSIMAGQLVDYRRNTTPAAAENTDAAESTKISALEQQVMALNADLSFARIDCNLDRADAQQIISNARQRKELLSQALGMLKSLLGSGDGSVQKKAKEKITRLNHIANTLHD